MGIWIIHVLHDKLQVFILILTFNLFVNVFFLIVSEELCAHCFHSIVHLQDLYFLVFYYCRVLFVFFPQMKYFLLDLSKLLSKFGKLFFVSFPTPFEFYFNQFVAKLNSFLLCMFKFNLLILLYSLNLFFKFIDLTLLNFYSFIVNFDNRGLLLLAKMSVGCIDVVFCGSCHCLY